MPPFDLKSVTCATSVPILVFLGLSVLDLGPMHATDRRQTASSLNAPAERHIDDDDDEYIL